MRNAGVRFEYRFFTMRSDGTLHLQNLFLPTKRPSGTTGGENAYNDGFTSHRGRLVGRNNIGNEVYVPSERFVQYADWNFFKNKKAKTFRL